MLGALDRREVIEWTVVLEADELLAERALHCGGLRGASSRDPLAVLLQDVLRIRLDSGGDIGGERPRRRRPDDQRLTGPVAKREAYEHRRIRLVLIDAALGQLVLRDRRATPWAPLGRTVAFVEVPPLVHVAQEAPDVLDVRIGEREVVRAPVHPLAEPDRAVRQLGRRPDHLLAATTSELGKAVLLDLALRVEPKLSLDADLDPEALTVEAVLIALVESLHRLVALEDVLQRSTPRGMHCERLVRGDRPIHEAEPRPALVLLTKPRECVLALPQLEELELERVVLRLVRQRCEDRRHEGVSLGKGFGGLLVQTGAFANDIYERNE